MRRGRQPLLIALVLSGVLHVLWLVDFHMENWHWPRLHHSDSSDVLASKKAAPVKRVRLASGGAPVSVIPQVYFIHAGSVSATDAAALAEKRAERQVAKVEAEKKAVARRTAAKAATKADTPDVTTPASEADVPAAGLATMLANADKSASFPLAIQAVQVANYLHFNVTLHQQWLMEGDQYRIDVDNNKDITALLNKVSISSEGHVGPDGLLPDHYKFSLNKKLREYADFDRGSNQLTYGKAGTQNTSELTPDFQDVASLPFEVAVSYEGEKDRTLKVTSGSSVYDIVLHVIAEETLRLPGGDLRTIHLIGSRHKQDGTVQDGYNIWLAPDFRNFPVKFSGVDGKGHMLTMSVQSLVFDGKKVFGKGVHEQPPADSHASSPATPSQGASTPDSSSGTGAEAGSSTAQGAGAAGSDSTTPATDTRPAAADSAPATP